MITSIFFIIILFYSIVFHEIAHGYAAYRNGDMTAFNAGRLTLNPLRHIDMIGSIIVPIISYFAFNFAFGWAKPVPYNPENIKHKKYGELEVASAGIIINLFIAGLAILIFYILKGQFLINSAVANILILTTTINLFLALFNLLPFPPADGFSIFSELFTHIRSFYVNIKNKFSKKKIYEANYINNNPIRNKSFYIKSLFSNPFMMIVIIFVAVNVFSLLVPFVLSFINYLYSF
ncbi:MAG: site-2 protease family protein [Candidatus Paceibacterota bacterium]